MLRVGDEATQDEVDSRSLLDEIAREGARRMLVAALEIEVAVYLEAHRADRDDEGHALVVRNGKGRTRKVTLEAGHVVEELERLLFAFGDHAAVRMNGGEQLSGPFDRQSPS